MTKKGISAASADFGLIALAYNLKRLFKLGWGPHKNPGRLFSTIYSVISAILRLFDDQTSRINDFLFKKQILAKTLSYGSNHYF